MKKSYLSEISLTLGVPELTDDLFSLFNDKIFASYSKEKIKNCIIELVKIYTKQNIRSDGCLINDVSLEEYEIKTFIKRDILVQEKFYNYYPIKLHTRVEKIIHKIIDSKIQSYLETQVDFPIVVIILLLEINEIKYKYSQGFRFSKDQLFDTSIPDGSVFENELISNSKYIHRLVFRYLSDLNRLNLAETAVNYVSTNRGELRDQYFIISDYVIQKIYSHIESNCKSFKATNLKYISHKNEFWSYQFWDKQLSQLGGWNFNGFDDAPDYFDYYYQYKDQINKFGKSIPTNIVSFDSDLGLGPSLTILLKKTFFGWFKEQVIIHFEDTIKLFKTLCDDNLSKKEEEYEEPGIYSEIIEKSEIISEIETATLQFDQIEKSISEREKLFLGYSIPDNEKIYFIPGENSKAKTPNRNISIVGIPGTGKSQLMKSFIHDLNEYKIPSIVLDWVNEYEGMDNTIDPISGTTINPLSIEKGAHPYYNSLEFSSIIKHVFKLGDIQEGILREALIELYKKEGINPIIISTEEVLDIPFARIIDILEEIKSKDKSKKSSIESLILKLKPFVTLNIFGGPDSNLISMDDVLSKKTAIFLKGLLNDDFRKLFGHLFLDKLWHYIQKLDKIDKAKSYLILDEANRLQFPKSPLERILREGRKFGFGIVIASQRPRDFTDTVFGTVSLQICFKLQENKDINIMAKQLGCDPKDIKELKPNFEAIVKFDYASTPIKVRIQPFFERAI